MFLVMKVHWERVDICCLWPVCIAHSEISRVWDFFHVWAFCALNIYICTSLCIYIYVLFVTLTRLFPCFSPALVTTEDGEYYMEIPAECLRDFCKWSPPLPAPASFCISFPSLLFLISPGMTVEHCASGKVLETFALAFLLFVWFQKELVSTVSLLDSAHFS